MSKLKLLYFNSCPNFEPAKKLLNQAALEFELVCQDDLPENDPLKSYTSPTLLLGERVIFGQKSDGGSGCSVSLPTLEELKERLCPSAVP